MVRERLPGLLTIPERSMSLEFSVREHRGGFSRGFRISLCPVGPSLPSLTLPVSIPFECRAGVVSDGSDHLVDFFIKVEEILWGDTSGCLV